MRRERMQGWGGFPVVVGERTVPEDADALVGCARRPEPRLAQGNLRSYGDACLFERATSMLRLDRVLAFDPSSGLLEAEAGITLDALLRHVVKGWFLPVTPGTRHVTLGGCVSADVHGKNHHSSGSFGRYVEAIEMVLAGGERVRCSRSEGSDLFRAAVGGMGLLGYILSVTLRLRPIASAAMVKRTIPGGSLDEVCGILEETEGAHEYSVAWIDCLAPGRTLGRGLVYLGEHAPADRVPSRDPLHLRLRTAVTVPLPLPECLLGRPSMRAFNALVFRRGARAAGDEIVPLVPFFYPLDAVGRWNRVYGRRGFLQYQVAVPKRGGLEAVREVIARLAAWRSGAFLAVLKTFSGAQEGFLSFPLGGYTLAADIPLRDRSVIPFLREIDRGVADAGGRVYLAKDAILEREVFEAMYPGIEAFLRVRRRYDPERRFRSLLSDRLGLT